MLMLVNCGFLGTFESYFLWLAEWGREIVAYGEPAVFFKGRIIWEVNFNSILGAYMLCHPISVLFYYSSRDFQTH